MSEPIAVYAFPISHYGEKVRWALDYSGINYHAVDHWMKDLYRKYR
jgi:glutathione S-transferase